MWVGFEGISRKCTSGGTWLVLPCATVPDPAPEKLFVLWSGPLGTEVVCRWLICFIICCIMANADAF